MNRSYRFCRKCGEELPASADNYCRTCGVSTLQSDTHRVISESNTDPEPLSLPNKGVCTQILNDLTRAHRLGRIRFVAYTLGFHFVLLVPTLVVLVSINDSFSGEQVYNLLQAVWIFLGLPYFLIRIVSPRLHDMGRSGWWGLLFVLPFANFILLLALTFCPGIALPDESGGIHSHTNPNN